MVEFYEVTHDKYNGVLARKMEYASPDVNCVVDRGDVLIATSLLTTLIGGDSHFYTPSHHVGRTKYFSLGRGDIVEDILDKLKYPAHSVVMVETKKRNTAIFNQLSTLGTIPPPHGS